MYEAAAALRISRFGVYAVRLPAVQTLCGRRSYFAALFSSGACALFASEGGRKCIVILGKGWYTLPIRVNVLEVISREYAILDRRRRI